MRSIRSLAGALALLLSLAGTVLAQDKPPIKLGYAKCAHCTPLTLVPDYAKDATIEAIAFNTGNDVLTALVSKSIDIGQITYLHYVTALDKGFDLVAISGQVNGGSQILVSDKLPVSAGDWKGLRKLVAERKAAGIPLKVAASRGNAQDLHMRGAFAKQGIEMKDVEFVNIPNPSDHAQALRRGEVDLICSVEPFASQIRQVGAGRFFAFPYDQPAGNLTNLILTRPDVIASNRKGVQATVSAIVKVDQFIAGDHAAWSSVITKVTGLDKAIANAAIENLVPDFAMHKREAQAIASMMKDLRYISKDVSAELVKNMDYSFLEAATGKPISELGGN